MATALIAAIGIFVAGCSAPREKPPVAAFTFHPLGGEVPLTVTFDASASYDQDGRIVEYRWDFGNETLGEGPLVQHRFTEEGTYRIILTVFDDDGLSGCMAAEITAGISYPLDVLEWHLEPTTWGLRVTGVAKNIGQRVIEAARVAVRFYRYPGELLREDSEIRYDLDLAPGEELAFVITSSLREYQIDPALTEIYTEIIRSDN